MKTLLPILLLVCSNVFMTAAWYWHVRGRDLHWPLPLIILASWLIALPEYCLAVPANRLGNLKSVSYTHLDVYKRQGRCRHRS